MIATEQSELDFEIAEIDITEFKDIKDRDLLNAVNDIPEINVSVDSLIAGFQLRRGGTDAGHVRLLAEAAASASLPSILVQKSGFRIIDGLHRLQAAKLRSEPSIKARIVDCTDEEALVLAVKSNTLHGLPLTRADRVSSAERILTAHPDWSDRAVAEITGLSAKSIASLRCSSAGSMQFGGKRLGRDGKRHPVMPGEARRRAAEYIRSHPDASLRQIARETDVSLGTASDVRERLRGEAGPSLRAAEPAQRPSQSAEPTPFPGRRAADPVANTADPVANTADTAVPRTVTSIHRQAQAYNAGRLFWVAVSAKLAADPSLRYTEGGRAFLRWMATRSMQADEWRGFINAIPERWLHDVSRIAIGMSDEWRQFAEHLRARIDAVS